MEAALAAGRWGSSAAARIYIEGDVADLVRAGPSTAGARAVALGILLLQLSAEKEPPRSIASFRLLRWGGSSAGASASRW
eukprot:6255448-Pyramimonas_sp.AAC.1